METASNRIVYVLIKGFVLSLTLTPSQSKVIDLSYSQSDETLYWPGMPKWNFTTTQRGFSQPDQHWLEFGVYSSGEHGGTHIDAPRHLFPDGYDVSEVPLENTIAEGVMVVAVNEVLLNSSYAITVEKLLHWESVHGRIPNQSAVLFNFGWGRGRWPNVFAYLNTQTPGIVSTVKHPHVRSEAAHWLIDQRDVMMIGMDTPSPDLPFIPGLPAHHAILANNRIILENVKMSPELPATGFRLHAAPIKSVRGTGIQTRVYAVVPDNKR